MNDLLREDDIIVLDFPIDQWIPTVFFDIETAEEKIWGLVILPKKNKWRLEKQETFINRILIGNYGMVLEQLVGVFRPLRVINFNNLLSSIIQERKDLFERTLSRI